MCIYFLCVKLNAHFLEIEKKSEKIKLSLKYCRETVRRAKRRYFALRTVSVSDKGTVIEIIVLLYTKPIFFFLWKLKPLVRLHKFYDLHLY